MDSLIDPVVKRKDEDRMRPSFDLFKSGVCHQLKNIGDIPFIIQLFKSNQIRELFEKKWYLETLYLLTMLDYLSKENNVQICHNYDDSRCAKLEKLLYPSSLVILCDVMGYAKTKEDFSI